MSIVESWCEPFAKDELFCVEVITTFAHIAYGNHWLRPQCRRPQGSAPSTAPTRPTKLTTRPPMFFMRLPWASPAYRARALEHAALRRVARSHSFEVLTGIRIECARRSPMTPRKRPQLAKDESPCTSLVELQRPKERPMALPHYHALCALGAWLAPEGYCLTDIKSEDDA